MTWNPCDFPRTRNRHSPVRHAHPSAGRKLAAGQSAPTTRPWRGTPLPHVTDVEDSFGRRLAVGLGTRFYFLSIVQLTVSFLTDRRPCPASRNNPLWAGCARPQTYCSSKSVLGSRGGSLLLLCALVLEVAPDRGPMGGGRELLL